MTARRRVDQRSAQRQPARAGQRKAHGQDSHGQPQAQVSDGTRGDGGGLRGQIASQVSARARSQRGAFDGGPRPDRFGVSLGADKLARAPRVNGLEAHGQRKAHGQQKPKSG